MRYKADYHPSELLCPEKFVWVAIDDTVRAALDAHPYVALSRLPGAKVQPNLSLPAPAVHERTEQPMEQLQQPQCKQVHKQPQKSGQQNLGKQHAAEAAHSSSAAASSANGWSLQAGGHVPPAGSLDEQLAFAFGQPLPLGVLRQSGLLDVQKVEQQLREWVAVVGRTCRRLVYFLPDDLLVA